MNYDVQFSSIRRLSLSSYEPSHSLTWNKKMLKRKVLKKRQLVMLSLNKVHHLMHFKSVCLEDGGRDGIEILIKKRDKRFAKSRKEIRENQHWTLLVIRCASHDIYERRIADQNCTCFNRITPQNNMSMSHQMRIITCLFDLSMDFRICIGW